MNKINKAKKIGIILDELFPNPKVPLIHKDPYTLLIAVLLSAQSTDLRVNQISPLLFQKASTPEKMVGLSLDEIEKIIKPIGLFKTKAKAIWHLSNRLLERHKGKVPKTLEELEDLPGVGHKTASVVLAQAFKIPAFPVDTHIKRCAVRWGLSKAKKVEGIEKDLKSLFPKKEWIKKHLQIIFFARTYCPARGHKKERCPICSLV